MKRKKQKVVELTIPRDELIKMAKRTKRKYRKALSDLSNS